MHPIVPQADLEGRPSSPRAAWEAQGQPPPLADALERQTATAQRWWHRPGIVALVLAALCSSGSAALVKATAGRHSTFQILALRGMVTWMGTSIALFLANASPVAVADRRTVAWSFGRGVLGTGALALFFLAVSNLPLSEGVVLYNTSPVFVAVLARVLMKEALGFVRAIGLLVFVSGAVVAVLPPSLHFEASVATYWGWRIGGIVAAVLAALAVVCARRMLNHTSDVEANPPKSHWAAQGWWLGLVSATCAPMAALIVQFSPIVSANDAGTLVGLSLIALVIQTLAGYALQRESAAVVSVLWNMDIVFALIWQRVIFQSAVVATQIIGVVVVLFGALLSVLEDGQVVAWFRRCPCCRGSSDPPLDSAPLDGADIAQATQISSG